MMPFNLRFITISSFIIISFLILFAARDRVTTVIGLIICHLIAIVFLSISITNYISFKEIILSLIVYSMIVLFLVSSNEKILSEDSQTSKSGFSRQSLLFLVLIFFALTTVFFSLFAVTQNIDKISENLRDKKLVKQQEMSLSPVKVMPQNIVQSNNNRISFEVSERKKARLKDRLSDNFIFKRYSDIILLIVATSAILLIISNNNPEEDR